MIFLWARRNSVLHTETVFQFKNPGFSLSLFISLLSATHTHRLDGFCLFGEPQITQKANKRLRTPVKLEKATSLLVLQLGKWSQDDAQLKCWRFSTPSSDGECHTRGSYWATYLGRLISDPPLPNPTQRPNIPSLKLRASCTSVEWWLLRTKISSGKEGSWKSCKITGESSEDFLDVGSGHRPFSGAGIWDATTELHFLHQL